MKASHKRYKDKEWEREKNRAKSKEGDREHKEKNRAKSKEGDREHKEKNREKRELVMNKLLPTLQVKKYVNREVQSLC